MHQATIAQLRDIDRVATACLRNAARKKVNRVDIEFLQDTLDADTPID